MTDNNIGEEASDMENKVTENENDNLETNQSGKFHRIPTMSLSKHHKTTTNGMYHQMQSK